MDQMRGETLTKEVISSPKNSPKTSKETWVKIEGCYMAGSFLSIRELGDRFGVHEKTLQSRILREDWKSKREALLSKVELKIEQKTLKAVDKAQEYLSNSFLRAKKYEALIEASIAQNATNERGVAIVAPSDLDAYSRSELRIHELALSALRIPRTVALDVTSKGLSVGESIVTAIEKLRANPTQIVDITAEEVARIAEMEVIPDRQA